MHAASSLHARQPAIPACLRPPGPPATHPAPTPRTPTHHPHHTATPTHPPHHPQNFLALIPLALFLGEVTEDLAVRFGDTVGGLLNATFGNVVEL